MIEIDGSYGEGGGQIVRASVALSCLTSTPVKIINIRARRRNPGLRAQHASAIKLLAKIFDAEVEGCDVGSNELVFRPSGGIRAGKYKFDIGTAGSITLLLQAITFALIGKKERISLEIVGGTDVPFSPTSDYFRHAYLELISRFGYSTKMKVLRRGYYPPGGGKVLFEFKGHNPKSIILEDCGRINEVHIFSSASLTLKKPRVCERMSNAAAGLILKEMNISPKRHIEYSDSLSDGCAICCVAKMEKSIISTDVLGKKGVPSEKVGNQCALALIDEIKKGACVDKHMADHLIPFLAVCGGRIKTSEITLHTKTLIWLVSKFLNVKFTIDEAQGIITCEHI